MLGVPLGTSKPDCKKAYFKLAKIWHPDKHQVHKLRIRVEYIQYKVEWENALTHLSIS